MEKDRVSVMKELHKLMGRSDKLYDGQVEFVLDDEEEQHNPEDDQLYDMESFIIFYFYITPKEGPYRNARIKFKTLVELYKYPEIPPEITCKNNIYHPNIDIVDELEDGSICVSLLDNDWTPEVGLDGAIMAVLFLFYNPELDDTLSCVCTGMEDKYEEFEKNVRKSLRGENIGEFSFDKLMKDGLDETGAENVEKVDGGKLNDAKVDGANVDRAEMSGAKYTNAREHDTKVEDASEEARRRDEDLSNQNSVKHPFFKVWRSKLMRLFSPIMASFRKR